MAPERSFFCLKVDMLLSSGTGALTSFAVYAPFEDETTFVGWVDETTAGVVISGLFLLFRSPRIAVGSIPTRLADKPSGRKWKQLLIWIEGSKDD